MENADRVERTRGQLPEGLEVNRNRIDWEALAALPYLKEVRENVEAARGNETAQLVRPVMLMAGHEDANEKRRAKRSKMGRVPSRPTRQQAGKQKSGRAELPTVDRKVKLIAPHQHNPRIISSSSRMIFYSGP